MRELDISLSPGEPLEGVNALGPSGSQNHSDVIQHDIESFSIDPRCLSNDFDGFPRVFSDSARSHDFLPLASQTADLSMTLSPFNNLIPDSMLITTRFGDVAPMSTLPKYDFLHQDDGDALGPQQTPSELSSARSCPLESTTTTNVPNTPAPGHAMSHSRQPYHLHPMPIPRITPQYACLSPGCSARFLNSEHLE